jgi:hypothetical protein
MKVVLEIINNIYFTKFIAPGILAIISTEFRKVNPKILSLRK